MNDFDPPKDNNSVLEKLITLGDFEAAAKHLLNPAALEYLECGVADERTLQRNRSAFDNVLLNPRVLVDVSRIDTSVSLLGRKLAFPLLLAPTGYHKLFHPNGEIETVRGANKSGAQMIAASFATVAIEDMAAEAAGPLWFQCYFQYERENTRRVLERALKAGCSCLCLTVDLPVNPPRDREYRAGFQLPPGTSRANFDFLGSDVASAPHRSNIYNALHSPKATWDDIEWLRTVAPVPLILKGILNPEDAKRAVECGCQAIVVSNHGGRSVDTVPSTLEALPRVKEAVGNRIPVLMDGGIRRGTDVFKALALGAAAVLIGRPYIHGLAIGGSEGVAKVVSILRTELEMTMGLAGCCNLSQISSERIWK